MATIKLWTDEEAAIVPDVKTVFDDIRATRKSDFVNNFWGALANQPRLLERTWSSVKQVMMESGILDPLTKELVYIAVSKRTAAATASTRTRPRRAPRVFPTSSMLSLAVVGMAAETNSLANSMQVPMDRGFLIG